MIVAYRLGMFTDFFDWVKDVVSTLFSWFHNMFDGVHSLYVFVFSAWEFTTEITSYLPSLLAGLILVGFSCLIIKFVVNR